MVMLPVMVQAQSNRNSPLLLELPSSTRGLGLGGAYVLSSPDPDALFSAPFVINGARGASFAVQRFHSASTLVSASAATTIAGGVLAVGVQTLSYGTPNTSELVMSVGFGRPFMGLRLGIAGKFIEQRIAGGYDWTAAVDAGIAKEIFDITWGLSVFNLGPGLTIVDTRSLPHRVTFGASTRSFKAGPVDLLGSANVSRLWDAEVVPAAGLEVSYWPIVGRTFTGRAGLRRVPYGAPYGGAGPITFGASFTTDNIAIDYAYEGFDGPGSTHRINIRWRRL